MSTNSICCVVAWVCSGPSKKKVTPVLKDPFRFRLCLTECKGLCCQFRPLSLHLKIYIVTFMMSHIPHIYISIYICAPYPKDPPYPITLPMLSGYLCLRRVDPITAQLCTRSELLILSNDSPSTFTIYHSAYYSQGSSSNRPPQTHPLSPSPHSAFPAQSTFL